VKVLAIVPARGGSKGIVGKNLAPVAGVPLVVRAVTSTLATRLIDRVIVSTDDAQIALAAEASGASVRVRPDALAGDTATSESALLDVLDSIERAGEDLPAVVVFVQPTSPFIDAADLDRAISRVLDDEHDVVFSAVETYAFLWEQVDVGAAERAAGEQLDGVRAAGARVATGVNHDSSFRPRRQDRAPHYRETGAFYVMRTAGFREAGFRFFGRVGIAEVSELGSIEIDTPEELLLANAIAPLLEGATSTSPTSTAPTPAAPTSTSASPALSARDQAEHTPTSHLSSRS
jgi:CMP-N-acetylneuraminic acid synthetase